MTRPPLSAVLLTLQVDKLTAEVVRDLREHHIRPIVLKGRSLDAWMPPEERPRTYVDVDLLVAPVMLEETWRRLRTLGFRPLLSPRELPGGRQGSMPWTRDGDVAHVDLHDRLTGATAPPEHVWEVFDSMTEPLFVAGEEMRCLSAPARALHVALHVAQHGTQFPSPVRDLRCALGLLDESVWLAAREVAGELGALDAFAAGLRLDPGGAALADRLALPVSASRQIALRIEGAPLTLGLDAFLATRGWRSRAAMVWHELFPSRAFMRIWSPRASQGGVRLALAYLGRPFWLAWRLPAGIKAWWRVRRQAND